MYESFYKFTKKPFQLNPDPQFYFDSRQHRRAMAFVEYGLHQSEGFIVVTGEIGAGKTTIVRNLLANLDSKRVVAANLVSTQLGADDTLRMVAAAFGVRSMDVSKSELLLSLEALLTSHARQGRRCLLIVDEAQNLSERAVEELRMLSNFQLGTHALLQSFLVGQPEFRRILQSPQMNQLRQRVIAACHIGPLDPDETRRYIEHRLRQVGWEGVPEFAPEAFKEIFEASGGVPRRINLLCDRLLLAGYLAERLSFSASDVTELAEEIRAETLSHEAVDRPPSTDERPRPAPAALAGPASNGALAARPERRPGDLTAVAVPHEDDSLERQLAHVEQAIKELNATQVKLERGSQAILSVFRRFLDWVRTREQTPGDRN